MNDILIQFKRSGLFEETLGEIQNKSTYSPEFRKESRKLGPYLIHEKVKNGSPSKIVLIAAIGSKYVIELIENNHLEVKISCATIGKKLNESRLHRFWIGDAGDRVCHPPH